MIRNAKEAANACMDWYYAFCNKGQGDKAAVLELKEAAEWINSIAEKLETIQQLERERDAAQAELVQIKLKHGDEEGIVSAAYLFQKAEQEVRAYMRRQQEATAPKWISVEERLPEAETQILILAKRGKYFVITNGMYEDGTLSTEDSDWHWYDHDFEYDEESDVYIIPKGWWEYKHYNGDDEYNHAIDDKVTHWMPLPEPPKEVE